MKRLLCFAAAFAAPLCAAVRVLVESTSVGTNEVTHQEVLLDAERMRVNITGKDTLSSCFTDGRRNRMVMLDKSRNDAASWIGRP
jgi:hypothetical protein